MSKIGSLSAKRYQKKMDNNDRQNKFSLYHRNKSQSQEIMDAPEQISLTDNIGDYYRHVLVGKLEEFSIIYAEKDHMIKQIKAEYSYCRSFIRSLFKCSKILDKQDNQHLRDSLRNLSQDSALNIVDQKIKPKLQGWKKSCHALFNDDLRRLRLSFSILLNYDFGQQFDYIANHRKYSNNIQQDVLSINQKLYSSRREIELCIQEQADLLSQEYPDTDVLSHIFQYLNIRLGPKWKKEYLFLKKYLNQ